MGVVETLTDLTELTIARQKFDEARQKLQEIHQFGNIIGKSDVMQDVFRAIQAVANSDATILIQGESGTGKELVAGAIHYNHDRFGKPMNPWSPSIAAPCPNPFWKVSFSAM